ncbi:hypothetical protein Tco_1297065, partial [Tanacetum coccineum]
SGPDDEVAAPRVDDIVAASTGGASGSGNNPEASILAPDANSPTDDFYDS